MNHQCSFAQNMNLQISDLCFFTFHVLSFCSEGFLYTSSEKRKKNKQVCSGFSRSDATVINDALKHLVERSSASEYVTRSISDCIICTSNSCQHSHETQLLTVNTAKLKCQLTQMTLYDIRQTCCCIMLIHTG